MFYDMLVQKKPDFVTDVEEGLQMAASGSHKAYFYSIESIRGKKQFHCKVKKEPPQTILGHSPRCVGNKNEYLGFSLLKLQPSWQSMFPGQLSMGFPKGSPYYKFFKHAISAMLERGQLHLLNARFQPRNPDCGGGGAEALSMEKIFTLFFFMVAGIVGSLILLLFECLHRPTTSKPKPPTFEDDDIISDKMPTLTKSLSAPEANAVLETVAKLRAQANNIDKNGILSELDALVLALANLQFKPPLEQQTRM
jgi:hypothetical protein